MNFGIYALDACDSEVSARRFFDVSAPSGHLFYVFGKRLLPEGREDSEEPFTTGKQNSQA